MNETLVILLMFFAVFVTVVLINYVAGILVDRKIQATESLKRDPAQESEEMISSKFEDHKGLVIQGSLSEVSAECILIMREIYKKNKEIYNKEIATGILTNMLVKAIDENAKHDDVEWKISEEEMLNYTE